MIEDNISQIPKQGLGTRSLFVVGDDAQSIYGFRGSKIEIILGFEKQYSTTKEIILNQNYRSTQSILDLAEKILTHNPSQKKKNLFTDNPNATKVYYTLVRNERQEAEFILRQIFDLYGKTSNSTTEKTSKTLNQNDPVKQKVKSEFSLASLESL